jgi:hypothetical protein
MQNCNILKIYQAFIRSAIAPSSRPHDLRTMGDTKSVVLSLDKNELNRAVGTFLGLQRG